MDLDPGVANAAGYSLRDGAHEGECHTSFKIFGFTVGGRTRKPGGGGVSSGPCRLGVPRKRNNFLKMFNFE